MQPGRGPCIVDTISDEPDCENPVIDEDIVCEAHVEYFEELPVDSKAAILKEVGACAHHLAVCRDRGQVDVSQQRLLDLLIEHLEAREIPARQHADRVFALYKNNPENTASKRIETEQEAFLAEHIDGFEGTY